MVIDFHTHAFPDAIAKKAIDGLVKSSGGLYPNCSDGTLGGEKQWDEVEEYMVGKNVYLDTSMGSNYYPKEQFVRIIKNHGSDKILFGSDSPWSRADEEIAFIRGLDISEEEKENILFKNAKRLLGI